MLLNGRLDGLYLTDDVACVLLNLDEGHAMHRFLIVCVTVELTLLCAWAHARQPVQVQVVRPAESIRLTPEVRARCLSVLRKGIRSEEFWPSIHALEGLTIGGEGKFVRGFLGSREFQTSRPAGSLDDQQRCGISRELVRAGDRFKAHVMLRILGGEDDFGHVHAAESLYKVEEIGDGSAMRRAFDQRDNLRLKVMAAAALGRCGNPVAMRFLRTEVISHEDPEVFKLAAWILGRIGRPSDIPLLKKHLSRCPDEITRAYFQNSLAALGDAGGLQALADSLTSPDAAVRTYGATFAGDARATGVAEQLIRMLDDEHADTRYRAAQSLLSLAQPVRPDRTENVSSLVWKATAGNPRYTEGSIVERADGSLLFAVTEFQDSGSDFAKAHIVGRVSDDGGRTWGSSRVLQKNTGGLNVMSVTLRRVGLLKPPAIPGPGEVSEKSRPGFEPPDVPFGIGMFYLQKNGFNDLDCYVRFSRNEGRSFGPPVLITADPGYHVVNNDRVTQLSTGRLLVPAASTKDVKTVNHFVSHCYISDDGGTTWRNSRGHVDAAGRGAMEPEVVELSDGRLLMILRTQLGYIGRSHSTDGGETWSPMESLGVRAPEAPATLRRIPATGDLVLIWNDTYKPGTGHGGERTPLTAAISSDDGRPGKQSATWNPIRRKPSPTRASRLCATGR